MGAKSKKHIQNNSNRAVSHPLYGEIPLIQEYAYLPNGQRSSKFWWRRDPNFQPPLPKGAIRGDVNKQVFCAWCHTPQYFYVDIEKTCIQCGEAFVFSAREQKYWYETLKFNFRSTAVRCKNCRRKRRSDHALQQQLSEASRIANENPDDPLALIELAKTTVHYFSRFHKGNLDQAISAVRKAFHLAPDRFECLFWEAKCQEALGRTAKAKTGYQQFVEAAEPLRQYRSFVKEATERLSML